MNLNWKQIALLGLVLAASAVFWLIDAKEIATLAAGVALREFFAVLIGLRSGPALPLLLVASLAAAACGDARQTALRASFGTLEAARVGLVAYNAEREAAIVGPVVEACECAGDPPVCSAVDTIECREAHSIAGPELLGWRLKVDKVIQAAVTVYALVAAAAFDGSIDAARVGAAVAELVRLVDALKGDAR